MRRLDGPSIKINHHRKYDHEELELAHLPDIEDAMTGQARAGCSDVAQPSTHHSSARFTPAVYRPGESIFTAITPVGDEWNDSVSIVGLWEFEVQLNGAQ